MSYRPIRTCESCEDPIDMGLEPLCEPCKDDYDILVVDGLISFNRATYAISHKLKKEGDQ